MPLPQEELIESIRLLVGDGGLISGDEVRSRPDTYGQPEGCQAACIVRPKSTQQISEILKLCTQWNQPVVTHGGMTGLVQGCKTKPGDLVISLERMRAIESVDTQNRTMTAQAGAVLQQVHEAAELNGLYFPLDLGARGSATIGGNISTNAGGNSVIRYGMMREQVLGLEAVMADGTIISSMNTVLKNNTGYDLKQLFIGSEGTLGIVTRAVLRLRPLPTTRSTALVALDDFGKVISFLQSMEKSLAGGLSAFEVLWNDFYQLVVGSREEHGQPLAADHAFYVLLECSGSNETLNQQIFEQALEDAFEHELLADAAIAQSAKQRDGFWAIRDDVECMVKNLHPGLTFDVSMNISQMDEYVQEVKQKLREQFPESRSVFFGHIGDGNIHPVLTVGSREHEAVRQVEDIIYGCLRAHKGIISAEHGIGLEKKPYLDLCRSPEELGLMKTMKHALDPKNLLNPGKIF